MKVVQVVDSIPYVNTNCWQRQLKKHIRSQCDEHHVIDVGSPIPDADIIISTLKMRTLDRLRGELATKLRGRRLYVYDQDPWESFIDSGTIRGAYDRALRDLNVGSFIVTSGWWAEHVRGRGFPVKFARMWSDPDLCDVGVPWSSRPIRVGFMGSMHPFRRKTIDELKAHGLEVEVFPPGSYDDYLIALSQMQFFFHEEDPQGWPINGEHVSQNALWGKEVEVMARGCFPVRRYEPEAEAYHVQNLPYHVFNDLAQVPQIIAATLQDPIADERSRKAVEFIRTTPGWFKLGDLLTDER